MPKWLQGMLAPTLLLWLYAFAVALVLVATEDVELPRRADFASGIALQFILAFWVISDAQKRQRPLCYDYDSFVFFAGWLLVSIYLFQTRGVRAFLTLLCFAGIWGAAGFAAFAISFAWQSLSAF